MAGKTAIGYLLVSIPRRSCCSSVSGLLCPVWRYPPPMSEVLEPRPFFELYTNRPKQFTLWDGYGFWTTKLHKVTKICFLEYCSNNTQVAVKASKCHRALHVNLLLKSLRAFAFLCGDLRNRRLCWGRPCELPDVGRRWVGRGTWQDAGEGHSMPYRRNGIYQDHDPLRLPWLLHSPPGDCRVSAAFCRIDS